MSPDAEVLAVVGAVHGATPDYSIPIYDVGPGQLRAKVQHAGFGSLLAFSPYHRGRWIGRQ